MVDGEIKVALISSTVASHLMFRIPLIKALQEKGGTVFVLAPDFDISTRAVISNLGAEPVDISMNRIGMNPIRDWLDLLRLFRLLKYIKPDIVLSNFIKPVIYGTLASWFANVRYRAALIEGLGFAFTDIGTTPSFKKRAIRRLVSLLYRVSLSKANAVIFLNPDDINYFDRLGVFPKEKAFELGGVGVDLDEWGFSPPVAGPINFLFIGRLLVEKGIYDFIAAARIVKVCYPEARFVVLGSVDSNPSSISEVEMRLWVEEGVIEWPGHVDVKPWIQGCSVFVLPSYREGVPRSTQEAMAMGRAVITTDAPGCRQTVDEGLNGFLVPVRDPSALAIAMCKFIDDPELIAAMGRQSRRLAEERFDVHKTNQKLISLMGFEKSGF